jgi:hypothetical protein
MFVPFLRDIHAVRLAARLQPVSPQVWGHDAPAIKKGALRLRRRAMPSTATLLVIERVVGPPNEASEGKFSDLNIDGSVCGIGTIASGVRPTFAGWRLRNDRSHSNQPPLSIVVAQPTLTRRKQ